MSMLLLPIGLLAMVAAQRSPSDGGLRSDERSIAVLVSLQDPAAVAPQIDVTPGGLTTLSYFFLRNRGFVIRDTNETWVEATIRLAPSGHRYTTREGAGIGTTTVAYSVRVRFGRRVFVVVSGEIAATDAYVWEAERFGVSPATEAGRTRIQADLTGCLESFVASFDDVNQTLGR